MTTPVLSFIYEHRRFSRILAVSAFALLLSCRGESIGSAFNRSGQYRRAFYSSEAECRRLNPNPEIGCYEWVAFQPDGQVTVSLGGSDILERGVYTQQDDKIQLVLSTQTLAFVVADETSLIRLSNKTVWQAY